MTYAMRPDPTRPAPHADFTRPPVVIDLRGMAGSGPDVESAYADLTAKRSPENFIRPRPEPTEQPEQPETHR
jgi:hypothetical protein